MSENWSQKYKQIRKDIDYIKETYGEVYDYCGAWCNNLMFQQLLDSPNMKTAVEIYINMIQYYFENGFANWHGNPEELPEDDKKLLRIRERWLGY